MSFSLQNVSVYELMGIIKQRPEMFFGSHLKLTDLANFIFGYHRHPIPAGAIPFEYFNRWIKHKLNVWGPNHNWATAILKVCKGNEEKAFWYFFELLDEFHSLKPLTIYSSELTETNFESYYSLKNNTKSYRLIDKQRIVYPAPYCIKAIEFDYCVHCYHFDFNYAVNDSKKGIHDSVYETLTECFSLSEQRYGTLVWKKTSKKSATKEFGEIIHSSDHTNSRF